MKKSNLILYYKCIFLLVIVIFINGCLHQNNRKLDLDEYTTEMLQSGYKEQLFTITDVVKHYLAQIKKIDKSGPNLNSIITINPDALEIAKQLDKALLDDIEIGPLYGIPIILKDNIDTHDKMPTTAGSRVLKDSFPIKDSWVAKKLRQADAIILGKANLSEWANYRSSISSSGWSGINGQTKNPYLLDRNPCGSSSGSAVAVSSNLCAISIGTETWGSIICPSNANGIVGIKPTVGLWSRSGIIPISYTQDTPGPMARTVEDAAKLLGAITGVDTSDAKTSNSIGKFHSDYGQFLRKNGLEGKRIGYLKTEEGKNSKVDSLMLQAIDQMKQKGAIIIELDKIVDEDALMDPPEIGTSPYYARSTNLDVDDMYDDEAPCVDCGDIHVGSSCPLSSDSREMIDIINELNGSSLWFNDKSKWTKMLNELQESEQFTNTITLVDQSLQPCDIFIGSYGFYPDIEKKFDICEDHILYHEWNQIKSFYPILHEKRKLQLLYPILLLYLLYQNLLLEK